MSIMCIYIYIYICHICRESKREREKRESERERENASKTRCSHSRLNESLRILCPEMLRTSNEELSQFESTNPKFKLDSLKKEHILTSTNPQPQEGPIPPQAPLPQHVPTICCSMKISVAFLSFIARPKSPMRKWSSESRKRFLRLKICEGRRLHIHQDIFGMKRGWRFKKMWMAR